MNIFEVIATADGWKITGDIDASTTPALSEAFSHGHATADEGGVLVLDFEGVTFMDSSGLRVLIDLCSRVGPDRVALRAPSQRVRRLLEMTGLSDQFMLDDAVTD